MTPSEHATAAQLALAEEADLGKVDWVAHHVLLLRATAHAHLANAATGSEYAAAEEALADELALPGNAPWTSQARLLHRAVAHAVLAHE